MSGSPSGPGTDRSSVVTFGFSGTSMPAGSCSTVARRVTMSGMALKPPGMTSRSASSGMRHSASIRSRRDKGSSVLWGVGCAGRGSDGEQEALVALGGDLVALLAVLPDAPRVGHEDPWLAGHVGANVPGVGLGVEGVRGDEVDVVDPLVLGLRGRFDRGETLLPQVLDGVAHPVD